ncbi:hypothetical protein TTHERM_00384750 (macronuclear) [Tetrahymena thermophila SB210]|uniref:Uncharacterized protein n=1 Tax=Tetrahymena thermophila (strain SB210) TaxID=312017 RepID=Q23RL7_TETTS|nr:hypothetical protein TTHERM_00384750 [Tetrahymena thermophila SB210]EAR99031.1 hypothetical protein TTHERM_00384750 [Tetrahymena thermophila SB210]|eukprot:XP_001019276.1 hypothetical protein TTHERM_00384750 [Tetrahymena thermophila SB210]
MGEVLVNNYLKYINEFLLSMKRDLQLKKCGPKYFLFHYDKNKPHQQSEMREYLQNNELILIEQQLFSPESVF